MTSPTGYLLCGTPRTGSTLLCSLLTSTSVLGRPQSYFREPDEASWARRLQLSVSGGRVRDHRAFVEAVRAEGTTANGIFAARIMWGSLERVVERSHQSSSRCELAALEAALGPLAFVHLVREDAVAQAVSWARAEQTGYWQQGDAVARLPLEANVEEMKDLLDTIRAHNAAWRSWFARNAIQPHRVTYEELVADPRDAVEGIAARMDVALPASWRPVSPHLRQADQTNDRWADALRAVLPAHVE